MPDSTVNWADVADKALETGASAVAELSELVKGVAPEVWEIAIRQVYADAIGDFVGCLLPPIVIFLFTFLFREKITSCESGFSYENKGCVIIPVVIANVIAALLTVMSFFNFSVLVKTLINPSYYAIKLIADMI